MTRQQFVKKFWPLAVELYHEFGIYPVASISHALHESGADNLRAAARHSYFGFLKAKGVHTEYPDDETGWRRYGARMASTWPSAVKVSDDGQAFANVIAFAHDPDYVIGNHVKKAEYSRILSAIFRSVQKDVAKYRLEIEAQPEVHPLAVNISGYIH